MKSLKENFQKAHIVIIGSGIIGKFNALELSELGFRITIIDPAQLKNSSNAALGLLMGNMYQKRKGRDIERIALARAVRLHLNHQVFVYNSKTAVFD